MRPPNLNLTAAQKSRVTFTLFTTVALFAIFTVSAHGLLPCPAHENPGRTALLGKKRLEIDGKKKVVVVSRKRKGLERKNEVEERQVAV
jgi:hypothetical protein